MPGVISLPLPGEKFGPGADTFVIDNDVGPFPVDDQVTICLVGSGSTEEESNCAFVQPQTNQWFIRWLVPDGSTGWRESARGNFVTGTNMNLVAKRAHANGTVVWQTSVPVVLDNQEFAWQYGFQTLFRGLAQGGFTADDRATINSSQDNTESILAQWANYTSVTLPTLDQVLANIDAKLIGTILTATGPVGFPIGQLLSGFDPNLLAPADLSGGVRCDRIDVDVSFNALYGVNLEITTYPADWLFRTPDHAWSFKDLAVLSFWRSGGLVERHGIHALTHSVSPVPDSALFSLGPIFGYLQPGDYHITVDWADGVCGSLSGMVLP